MVLPAPDGPTSATSWPGSATNETSWSTCWLGRWSRTATASSEASDTSFAVGYAKSTWRSSTVLGPPGTSTASGASWIIGSRSSTSKTRSNDTSAVAMSTLTFDSEVSGP